MTARRALLLRLYWSRYSTSEVACLCGVTQERVRGVWRQALRAGALANPPGLARPAAGWPAEILALVNGRAAEKAAGRAA